MADNDILRGTPQILAYLNSLLSQPVGRGQVYGMIVAGDIQGAKVRGKFSTTKRQVREDLSRLMGGVPVGEPGQ